MGKSEVHISKEYKLLNEFDKKVGLGTQDLDDFTYCVYCGETITTDEMQQKSGHRAKLEDKVLTVYCPCKGVSTTFQVTYPEHRTNYKDQFKK